MLRTLAAAACGTGLLLLLAGHTASAPQVQAFVSGSQVQGLRVPNVARHVKHSGFSHAIYRNELRDKTDEELHDIIELSRKKKMHHRFQVWRKRKPSQAAKYEWDYKIALAKTFLKQREIAKGADEKDEQEPLSEDYPDRPTLTEWMKQNVDLESAKREFAMRPTNRVTDKYDLTAQAYKAGEVLKAFAKRNKRRYGSVYVKIDPPHLENLVLDPKAPPPIPTAAAAEEEEEAAEEPAAEEPAAEEPASSGGEESATATEAFATHSKGGQEESPSAFAGASGLALGLSAAMLCRKRR